MTRAARSCITIIALVSFTGCVGLSPRTGGLAQIRQAQSTDHGRAAGVGDDLARAAAEDTARELDSASDNLATLGLVVLVAAVFIGGAYLLAASGGGDVDGSDPKDGAGTPYEHAPNVHMPDFVRVALPR